MTPPIPARLPYAVGSVPADYQAGWMRQILTRIQQAMVQAHTRTVLASTTMIATDDVVLCDATAGAISYALLPANQVQFAKMNIKKVDVTANAVTLTGTVDGTVNPQILTPQVCLTIQSDGISWYII